MTKKIVWRLNEKPTSEALRQLVKDGLLSKDEAREILFSEHDETPIENIPKIEEMRTEIKFLRKLVEKFSDNNKT